ncbi:hypothetical protein J437_LFUL004346 [Ladona fulva]|uniref:P-type domain-containing protein n=1 Tax=Ladona fulva TaxID=123851 RepID=A0A8K0K5Q7_LADFU|nr:hypothetical protein J437_LFUL004346 [Ladona fulva]
MNGDYRPKSNNQSHVFGQALQQHKIDPGDLNQHCFSQHQKPSYEHFVGEEDDEDYEEDFGAVDCECEDGNKRKCGRKDCPRLNIATILICVLLFLVFVLLPAIYLLHCFDLLKAHWEISDESTSGYTGWERAMKDHSRVDSSKSEIASGDNAVVQPVSNVAAIPPTKPPPSYAQCSAIPEAQRFDCFPGEGASKEKCEARGCCWLPRANRQRGSDLINNKQKFKRAAVEPTLKTSSPVSSDEDHQRKKAHPNIDQDGSSSTYGIDWNNLSHVRHISSLSSTVESKWKNSNKLPPLNVPYCFFPPGDSGHYYSWLNISSSPIKSFRDIEFDSVDDGVMLEPKFGSVTGFLKLHTPSPYPRDARILRVDVRFETKERLRIKIVDAEHSRYEPPYPEVPIMDLSKKEKNTIFPQKALYRVEMDKSRTGFAVYRRSNNQNLFDSRSVGALVFADQFIQLSALLPPEASVYGFGEHQASLRLPTDWQRFVLFNHDTQPKVKTNLYGSHPFYMATEKDGSSYGVFLLNSNAMEVILQPGPAVTFRAIGGVLDFHFFLGPSPREVVSQFTDLVGRPFMPPLWGLGFHLCRFGTKTLNRTKEILMKNRIAGVPIDVQWNDLDYMSQANDFTYDNQTFHGLPEFIEELHKMGMHYIPIIDAGISGGDGKGKYPPYDEGLAAGIFIRNSSGLPFVGKVWNKKSTVWPDFTNPASVPYWSRQMERLHSQIAFDGAWIDMNEPSNFYSGTERGCPTSGRELGPSGRRESDLEHPPYLPPIEGSLLAYRTVCMSARHFAGVHYDVHNLHGFTHAIVTSFALIELRGKRPFVISRSTFSGHGHYAGHWTGDVGSTWEDMSASVPAILNFNIFGIPLVGADICGFNGNTTVELCNRWSQLGAFYPFSRNHNTDDGIDQDPASLGPEVLLSARNALLTRYSLLPYLYTLFWQSHAFGDTVARPVFFEFPEDPNTHSLDKQFMWGSALMIIPVGIWYDFRTKQAVKPESDQKITLTAPLEYIPLLVRGGTIIPMQAPNMTTTQTRQNNIELLVAVGEGNSAEGVLYWDDGDSLNTWEDGHYSFLTFTLGRGSTTPGEEEKSTAKVSHNASVEGSVLSGVLTWRGVPIPVNLGAVRVMGVDGPVHGVSANGQSVNFTYNESYYKYLVIENLNIDLNTVFIIMWY